MLSAPKFIGVDNYFRLFLNDDIFIIALKKYIGICNYHRTGRLFAFLLFCMVYQ